MKHKHKTWFVAVLLFLGLCCTAAAGRIEPRISIGKIPGSTATIKIPVKQTGTDGQAMLPPGVAPTPAPNAPVNTQLSIEAELASKPKTEHASELLKDGDYPQETYFALAAPNDPYAAQWPFTAIDSPSAWDVSTGSESIVIAVLDTGFGLQHEELQDQWYTNTGETGTTSAGSRCWNGTPADKATNDCDDDNNGYEDDWRGWDFFWADNDPATGSVSPAGSSVWHGTSVAALAAASTNNNKGIAGVNWKAKIMPLQVLSDNGNGITYDVVAAIEYAAKQGADVINLSLGTTQPDAALLAAIRYANSLNVTVVAAAGNCGNKPPTSCNPLPEAGNMTYPALYDEVISVGALTQSNARASFSSYGATLDVVAPGSVVPYSAGWSESNQNSLYATSISGTSFASPMVAGLAALVRGIDPALGPKDVRAILIDSTDKVSGMSNQIWSSQYGYGRVNALKALRLTQTRSVAIKSGPAPSTAKKAPLVALSAGTVPESPAAATDEIIATCGSHMGDSCVIEFKLQGTNEQHYLDAQKTDASGFAAWRFSPENLGISSGTWVVRAHGNSLSSESTMFYVQ